LFSYLIQLITERNFPHPRNSIFARKKVNFPLHEIKFLRLRYLGNSKVLENRN